MGYKIVLNTKTGRNHTSRELKADELKVIEKLHDLDFDDDEILKFPLEDKVVLSIRGENIESIILIVEDK